MKNTWLQRVTTIALIALALLAHHSAAEIDYVKNIYKFKVFQLKVNDECMVPSGDNSPIISNGGFSGLLFGKSCTNVYVSANIINTGERVAIPKSGDTFQMVYLGYTFNKPERELYISYFCGRTGSKTPGAVFDLIRLGRDMQLGDCARLFFKLDDGDVVKVQRDAESKWLCIYDGPNAYAAPCSLNGPKAKFSRVEPKKTIEWNGTMLGKNSLNYGFYMPSINNLN